VSNLQRIVLAGAHDDMVNQVDADDSGCVAQLARELEVGRTWRRVTAGVIVLCCDRGYVP